MVEILLPGVRPLLRAPGGLSFLGIPKDREEKSHYYQTILNTTCCHGPCHWCNTTYVLVKCVCPGRETLRFNVCWVVIHNAQSAVNQYHYLSTGRRLSNVKCRIMRMSIVLPFWTGPHVLYCVLCIVLAGVTDRHCVWFWPFFNLDYFSDTDEPCWCIYAWLLIS